MKKIILLFNKIGDLNIFTSFFYLIIGLIIFLALRNITDEKSFSKKLRSEEFKSVNLINVRL